MRVLTFHFSRPHPTEKQRILLDSTLPHGIMVFVRARLLAMPTDDAMSPRRAVLSRSSAYNPSRIAHLLSALECALISKDRVLPCFSRDCLFASPLECTFTRSGARKPFKMRTYRKRRGEGGSGFQTPPVFRIFFQVPYALSPFFLTSYENCRAGGGFPFWNSPNSTLVTRHSPLASSNQRSWDMPAIACVGGDLRRSAAIFASSLGTK